MSIKKSPSLLNIKKKVDFLFVSYGGGHLKAILPVANQLIKDGYSIKIFALTTAINDLIDSNIPYFSYKDLPEAYEEENIKLGIKLAKHLDIQNNKDNIVSYEESVAYLALNYKDLIRLYGQSKGRKMWLEEGRQIFYPIYLMKKVLNYIEPKIVISTNSPRSEKAAIRAASMLNIKSVCINDLFAIQESAWLKDNSFANKIFVLNDSVKKFLVGLGRAAEDIVVSGNPAFDSLFEKKFIDESNFIKE
jgi:UDP-N-acetylglucosamine:LPS N-acetylglucosamine transferase